MADRPNRIAFVCLHGSAKSLIAAEYFNRVASARGGGRASRAVGRSPDGQRRIRDGARGNRRSRGPAAHDAVRRHREEFLSFLPVVTLRTFSRFTTPFGAWPSPPAPPFSGCERQRRAGNRHGAAGSVVNPEFQTTYRVVADLRNPVEPEVEVRATILVLVLRESEEVGAGAERVLETRRRLRRAVKLPPKGAPT